MKIVAAAILLKNRKALIAKRKSTYRMKNKWELPGGTIEGGESPEEGLKRVLKEELRIDVTIGEYIGESISIFEFIPFSLLGYRTFWDQGDIDPKNPSDYNWVTHSEISNYDFVRAYLPFVEKIRKGEIKL
jgi:8-oxo-dGTP diphosphatase